MSRPRWLVEAGTFLLLALLPLVFSTSLADAVVAPKQALFQVAAALLVSGWALGAARGQWNWWPASPLARVGLLFYAWSAVTGLATGLPGRAVPGTLDSLLLAGVVLAWTATLDPHRARTWTGWVCASTLLVGLYSHLQRLTPLGLNLGGLPLADPIAWSHPELSRELTISTFGNPDYLSAWLVAVLPLALSWILALRRPAGRWVALSAWVVVALAMVLTLTRAAWFGAAVATLVWTLRALTTLTPEERRKAVRILAGLGLVLALGVGTALVMQADNPSQYTVRSRLASLADLEHLSLKTRFFFWGASLRILRDHPWMGVGPGGFPSAALLHRDLEPVATRFPPRLPETPHSQYMLVAAETGAPGLTLLAILLVLYFSRAGRPGDLQAAGLLGSGAAWWANHAFSSATLPTEVLWVFLVALVASREAPPRLPGPASSRATRRAVALAALLLVATNLWLSERIVRYERLTWLGDDSRYRAAGMIRNQRHTGREIVPHYERALRYYEEALNVAPAWSQASCVLTIGKVYEEMYLDLTGRQAEPLRQQAREAYLHALEIDPQFPTAWISLATIQAWNPRESEQALMCSRGALDLDPRNALYLDVHARLLLQAGRYQEALATWETSLENLPRLPQALLGKAEALYGLGRDTEAEEALAEATRLEPRAEAAARRIRAAARPASPGGAEELPTDRRSGANPVLPAEKR